MESYSFYISNNVNITEINYYNTDNDEIQEITFNTPICYVVGSCINKTSIK